MRVACRDLRVQFDAAGGPIQALDRMTFDTHEGEFLTLLGPSGCGKTTLLRTIAGLIRPSGGSLEFTANGAQGGGLLVFQENSLFPWMTALENAAFGMEMLGIPRAEREAAARRLMERHGLGGRERAYPHELSAGMKQRVAVLRAFLSDPPMLLMDEPFAALDGQTRVAMQSELLELWQTDRRPVIFVTHDVDEAIYLSDRILVLSAQPARVVGEFTVPLSRHDRGDLMLGEPCLYFKRAVLARLQEAAGGVLRAQA